MKAYQVLVKAYSTIIVEAEDETHAIETAAEQISSVNGFEIDEWSVDEELVSEEKVKRAIEYSAWHQQENKQTPYLG